MSWGTQKRNTIIFLISIILIVPLSITIFFVFYNPPNCFDNQKNGDEKGVDCGGNCQLLCTTETLAPVVVWERFFYVSQGNYNTVAYVENQNPQAGVKKANYIFKLYNEEGIEIANRTGSVRLYPKSITPIVENNLFTDKQRPVKVSFEFVGDMIFEKENTKPINLIIEDEKYFIDSVTNSPKVNAKLRNLSTESVNNIKVIVLLFDDFDNAVGSSSTFIDRISGEMVKDINFTWPNKLQGDVTKIEIIPLYE